MGLEEGLEVTFRQPQELDLLLGLQEVGLGEGFCLEGVFVVFGEEEEEVRIR